MLTILTSDWLTESAEMDGGDGAEMTYSRDIHGGEMDIEVNTDLSLVINFYC